MTPGGTHLRIFRPILALLSILSVTPAGAQEPAPPARDRWNHYVFTLDRFGFESGPTVPNVRLVYAT